MNEFNDCMYLKREIWEDPQDLACIEIQESDAQKYLKISVSLAFDPMFFSIPEYFRAS